jgi:PIN domain nuclease of toxin-antitoxin system
MRLLLDTHALLWFLLNDARLSAHARSLMSDLKNDLFVSPASYWEIAIKISIKKYALDRDLTTFLEEQIAKNNLTVLPITVRHAAVVATLPFHHRDPFDRLLASQAIVEQVPIVSADTAFDMYSVTRIWQS